MKYGSAHLWRTTHEFVFFMRLVISIARAGEPGFFLLIVYFSSLGLIHAKGFRSGIEATRVFGLMPVRTGRKEANAEGIPLGKEKGMMMMIILKWNTLNFNLTCPKDWGSSINQKTESNILEMPSKIIRGFTLEHLIHND